MRASSGNKDEWKLNAKRNRRYREPLRALGQRFSLAPDQIYNCELPFRAFQSLGDVKVSIARLDH